MLVRARLQTQKKEGYSTLVGFDAGMLMELGLLCLNPSQDWLCPPENEKALLLISGAATIEWADASGTHTKTVSRPDYIDSPPWVLSLPAGSLPAGAQARINAAQDGCEWACISTQNTEAFAPRLFTPEECMDEFRGAGTMQEASTRIVRTVMDVGNSPKSKLVVGEVVNAPGKWSSYPPHHHPQPEIYHYRISPSQGFGLACLGDESFVVKDGDSLLIREGQVHPQVAAPGYAMWYLWVIRHLEGNPYRTPTFVPEHSWVMDPKAAIRNLPAKGSN